jgi:hypothetical protein
MVMKIYVIALICKESFGKASGTYSWGWFPTFKEAENCLFTDIYENYYDYVVIEEYGPGYGCLNYKEIQWYKPESDSSPP